MDVREVVYRFGEIIDFPREIWEMLDSELIRGNRIDELILIIRLLVQEDYRRRFTKRDLEVLGPVLVGRMDDSAVISALSKFNRRGRPNVIEMVYLIAKHDYLNVLSQTLSKKLDEIMVASLRVDRVRKWAVGDAQDADDIPIVWIFANLLHKEKLYGNLGGVLRAGMEELLRDAVGGRAFAELIGKSEVKRYNMLNLLLLILVLYREELLPETVAALEETIAKYFDDTDFYELFFTPNGKLGLFLLNFLGKLAFGRHAISSDSPAAKRVASTMVRLLSSQRIRDYLMNESREMDWAYLWELAIFSDYKLLLPPEVSFHLDALLMDVLPTDVAREFLLLPRPIVKRKDPDEMSLGVVEDLFTSLVAYLTVLIASSDERFQKDRDDPVFIMALDILFDVLERDALGSYLHPNVLYKRWFFLMMQLFLHGKDVQASQDIAERLRRVLMDKWNEEVFRRWLLEEVRVSKRIPPLQGVWLVVVLLPDVIDAGVDIYGDPVFGPVLRSVLSVLQDDYDMSWLITEREPGTMNLWRVITSLTSLNFWRISDENIKSIVVEVLERALRSERHRRWLVKVLPVDDEKMPVVLNMSYVMFVLFELLRSGKSAVPRLKDCIEDVLVEAIMEIASDGARSMHATDLIKLLINLWYCASYIGDKLMDVINNAFTVVLTSDKVREDLLDYYVEEVGGSVFELPVAWYVLLDILKSGLLSRVSERVRTMFEDVLIPALRDTADVFLTEFHPVSNAPHVWVFPIYISEQGWFERLDGRLWDAVSSMLMNAMSSGEVRAWLVSDDGKNLRMLKRLLLQRGLIEEWKEPLKSFALREIEMAESILK